MTIHIGINPIGWSNDDMPELGGDTPLHTCLAEARQAGYAGLELGRKFPRTPDALQAELEPFGLRCVSGWHSIALLRRDPEAEFAAARAHLDLLKAMGSTVMIVCECSNTIHGNREVPLSRRPVLSDTEWHEFGRRLTRLGDLLAAEGMRLAYHHHMGSVVQTGAEIDRLMAETGSSVHLLLDTGHATWAGADPADLARRHRARIAHVHCKDVRPAVRAEATARDLSFLDAVLAGIYTVPGDGSINYESVFRALAGYSGWVVVEAEQDPARANPLVYAKRGYQALVRVLRDTGFELATPDTAQRAA